MERVRIVNVGRDLTYILKRSWLLSRSYEKFINCLSEVKYSILFLQVGANIMASYRVRSFTAECAVNSDCVLASQRLLRYTGLFSLTLRQRYDCRIE
jgi:hypothetical protein